jgi:DNA-binding response OmpR family regulator
LVKAEKPDLIVLDLMLPGIRGVDVCKKLWNSPETEAIPIIMLTAMSNHLDKVIGLELGADDYVTKPFHVRELITRIRAVLRRLAYNPDPDKDDSFTYKNLSINYRSYEVTTDKKKIDISPKELKLLQFLTQHPGRVYTRDQLLDYVWGQEYSAEPRTVDTHISRLRAIIEKDKNNPQYILTVRGIGYKFTYTK